MGFKLVQQFYFQRGDLQAKIPPSEHSIFIFMLFTAKDDGTAIYPSLETIANVTRHSLRQARAIVSDLEKKGFFERVATGRGRGNTPLWHVPLAKGPLGQENWITPRPLESSLPAEGQQDRRGQKQRAARLVPMAPAAEEPFLDVDQADHLPGAGKEVAIYHQEMEEYNAGYTPRGLPAIRQVWPQPGVKVEEVKPLPEIARVEVEMFQSTLPEQIGVLRGQLAERQQYIANMLAKMAARKASGLPPSGIFSSLKDGAEETVREILAAIADLEEMLEQQRQLQQVQKRREVL